MEFIVKSGCLNAKIEAKSHKMAAIKAIDENSPTELGLLISVFKIGDSEDDEIFMKTEKVLSDMGFDVSD